MMTGEVTPFREAVMELLLHDSEGSPVRINAVLDTGFTAYLTLPSETIAALALQRITTTEVLLADGSAARLRVYAARIVWDGGERRVRVHEADGGPLVGMSLMHGYRLTMDIVDGGLVILEPLP